MQKTKIICLILAVVLASAGTASLAMNMSNETVAPVLPNNSVDFILDKPTEGTPTDNSAIDNLYIAQGELQRKGGFVGTTTGTAVSAGIAQNVYNNRVVIGGNAFKEMITIGVVKNAYQLYISDGNYLYRNYDNIKSATNIKWSDTASRYSKDSFLEKFGHFSNTLTGYILNDETIVSGVLEKEENGLYTYRYVLDIEKAPARMLYEMKTNSNMNGFSVFSKAEIVVTMDADWQIKTLTTDCKYKVPMFGGVNCVENVTETFSDLTSDELPETEFFQQFFNASIIDKPVETDPDALSVLMDIFAPYIGDNNLNVSLNATMDGQTVLSGLVSAKIDIENISNIEVAAKLGNDLYVEYGGGAVYVTYQDFKASTTVDGIMGLVNALMPDADAPVDDEADESEEDGILSKFTYAIEGDLCTVNLPLDVGDEQLNVNIYANVVDGKYEFRNAEVTLASLKITIEPVSAFSVPAREGDYPEILGLLDLVKNGAIYGNVNAFGMDVDVMFDLASKSMYATSDNLALTYLDNTVYAEIGAIKAKLNVNDIDQIMSLLRIAGIIDGDVKMELPQISLDTVLATLGNIQATATSNGVVFGLSMDDLSVAIYLAAVENGWNVDKLTVKLGDNVITLAMTEPTLEEIPQVDGNEYADVMELVTTFLNPIVSLAQAKGYGASFGLNLTVDGVAYDVTGSFTYDAAHNLNVAAVVSNGVATVINANVTVADGVVYLEVNGLKTAFAADDMSADVDLTEIIGAIYGANDKLDGIIDAVNGIVNTVSNLDVASIDLVTVIRQFSFVDGVLALTVNADFVGLSAIDVQLSVNNHGDLIVGIDGVQLADVALDAQATVISNPRKVSVPNADDYVLNLAGSVSDTEFAVTADLLNMDISASVHALNNTVLIRYVDGKIYAKLGKASVVATVDNLGALVEQVMTALGLESANMPALPNVDLSVKTLLQAIKLDVNGANPSIGIDIEDLASVAVNFDSSANLVNVVISALGYNIEIVKSDERVPQLDLTAVYIPVETLAAQLTEIYTNYKNVLTTGIKADVQANVNINGSDYALTAQVNYNNGLYLNANVSDKANVLVAIDMYLVNNVAYLDLNGIRVATELPAMELPDNANIDLAAIVGLLAQAKGYNDVLDSVIEVIEQLPANLNGINYVDLLGAIACNDNVLSATINGSILGLSDFDVTLSGTNDITATISNLVIGKVAIESITLDVTPACSEITAPASDYVTELKVEVMGLTVTAKLDLYNKTVVAKTDLLGHELGLYYANNTVYVSYGAVNAKLDIADIDRLLDVVAAFVDGGIPSMDIPELDVKEIIDSLSKLVTDNGYNISIAIAGVNVTVNFDANASLKSANVSIGDVDVLAKVINGASYPVFDINADYVDLLVLAETFANDIRDIMNAEGYDITVNGSFAFDANVYGVSANVIYNGGLYVNANVWYNTANILDAKLWLVDNTLYAQVGELKLAIALSQSGSAQSGGLSSIDLTAYKGYNQYVDGILDVVQGAIDSITAGDIDYVALIDDLTFVDGVLTLEVNGAQLGLSNISLQVSAIDGIYANVSNLAIDKMTASFNANVKASSTAVEAPNGDFTTNLSIKIDDKNTVYANLDLIHGVYNFRLDDLYAMYVDNTIYVNKGDIYVSGNINDIKDYIKKIDDLVNEFSGATESTISTNLDMFGNIDVKAIVNSLAINVLENVATVSVSAFGFDVRVNLANGNLRNATVPVSVINKTLEIEPCAPQTFNKFDGEHDYIEIEQVFNDYFPAFERLVHTNSWKFNFDGDTTLSMNNANYKVAAGSYFEFYYKNTEGMDTFKLRAKLDIHKQRADGSWQPYMNVDVVYKDGNIYVTDKGRLVDGKKEEKRNTIKLTVSIKSLVKCYDLYDKLVAVVPQIGELVDNMMAAMAEAEQNAESMSYSTILNDVSYVDGLFGIDLNGAALLSKLGVVMLSAQTYGEGLSLNSLQLSYDTISLEVTNLRVYASEVVEVDGATEYAAVQDINAYDTTGHMDFNSLYELLSAFVITATPVEGTDVRSFDISGSIDVSLLGIDVSIGLQMKVDINEDGNTFITVKMIREKLSTLDIANAAFEDYGGNSYLYYDGVNKLFTVYRNSYQKHTYCSLCKNYTCSNGWHTGWHKSSVTIDTEFYGQPSYRVENITTEQFTANMIQYILDMVNFKSWINDKIWESINKENTNDYGIEDIVKDYSYGSNTFKVSADLSPIDSSLGALNVNILHDSDYRLTTLTGDIGLISICTAKMNLALNTPVYGTATTLVANSTIW